MWLAEFCGAWALGGPMWTCLIVEGNLLFLEAALSPETPSGTLFSHPHFLCPPI